MSWIKNVTLILVSSILGFVVFELGLRVLYSDENTTSPEIILTYGKGYGHKCEHGWCANPGQYPTIKKKSDGTEIYNVTYTIGSDRTRIFESANRTESKIAVNFFGGSYMFGEGLNDDETIPYFFNRMIPSANVKNYGFHGHGVHNALRLLELKQSREADLNILLTGDYHAIRSSCVPKYSRDHPSYRLGNGNDREVSYVSECRAREPSELDKINKTGFDNLYDQYLSSLKTFKLILQPVRNSFTYNQLSLYSSIIDDFVTLSKLEKSTPIIMYMKEKSSNYFGWEISKKYIADHLDQIGIDWVDVTLGKDIRSLDSSLFIHELDKHPSALANCMRTRILVSELVSRGIIKNELVDFSLECR